MCVTRTQTQSSFVYNNRPEQTRHTHHRQHKSNPSFPFVGGRSGCVGVGVGWCWVRYSKQARVAIYGVRSGLAAQQVRASGFYCCTSTFGDQTGSFFWRETGTIGGFRGYTRKREVGSNSSSRQTHQRFRCDECSVSGGHTHTGLFTKVQFALSGCQFSPLEMSCTAVFTYHYCCII